MTQRQERIEVLTEWFKSKCVPEIIDKGNRINEKLASAQRRGMPFAEQTSQLEKNEVMWDSLDKIEREAQLRWYVARETARDYAFVVWMATMHVDSSKGPAIDQTKA